MSVPDYNDPLRHTNLPSPHPSTTSISRVRGDSRHMIDVCLWRNQEGAQINFSLSSFDFVWLIYFLTPSQDAAWRMVNEKSVVCDGKLLRGWEDSLPFYSPICHLQLFKCFTVACVSQGLYHKSSNSSLWLNHCPNKFLLMSNWKEVKKLTCFSCICHFDGHSHNSH